MKKFLTDKQVKALKSYLRAVAAVAVFAGVQFATDLAPQYAMVIAAAVAPLIKWADKNDKDFGPKK
jgi:hypothetical protein